MAPPKLIKRRKVLSVLKRIENEGGVYLYHGGKHLKVVAIKEGVGAFMIPVSHPEVSSFILKGLRSWMKRHQIKGIEHIEDILPR